MHFLYITEYNMDKNLTRSTINRNVHVNVTQLPRYSAGYKENMATSGSISNRKQKNNKTLWINLAKLCILKKINRDDVYNEEMLND